MTQTITLTRTVEDAEGSYTETMTLILNDDEVREVLTDGWANTSDDVVHAGPNAVSWLRERLVEYRADGWREIS